MVLIALVLFGVVILLGVAFLLSINDDGLPEDTVDHGDLGVPDRALSSADIAGLRFRVGLRGYRMEDVDAALHRIEQSMREAGR